MNTWSLIRILFALSGIFVAGLLTGRFTAPQAASPPTTPNNTGTRPGLLTLQTGRNQSLTAPQIVRFYEKTLNLKPVQRASVVLLIREAVLDLQATEPSSPARLERVKQLNREIREQLPPEQQQMLDEAAATFESHWRSKRAGVK